MTILRLLILTITFTFTFITTVTSHNITNILSNFPEYTEFNKYLTQTKLNDDINNRQTITVLVLKNNLVSEFFSNQPLSIVKTALSIHVLLDYFDAPKLRTIGSGSMMTTTLYQTTGKASGTTGFVNITDLVGNKVGFGSGGEGSKLDALFEKSVKVVPYNISVLEISSPILAPGIFNHSLTSNANISNLLVKAGCEHFARYLLNSGVLKVYQTVERRGITVFAPTDAAFNASGLLDVQKRLTDVEMISLLLYHAVAGYFPKVSLMTKRNVMRTLASNEIAEFGLTVRTDGDSVTLDCGVDNSRVESTVLDSVPVSIFKIDHVLVPVGLFDKSPSPSPLPVVVPVPQVSPPSPRAPVSARGPIASSPAPVTKTSPVVSPPAPHVPSSSPISAPDAGPAPAPADNPSADAWNSNASEGIKAPVILLALIAVSGMILSIVG
ncbi:hypothetical protein QVD17_27878 [Tagetes erecta]|uniref:FAS1 domain-containing protein n=1 Tax=Tagetes erecta TaxID=13708 RepID=A0AAD8K9G4_TARER|nr:hypothetical protein QVD17_27878 [Tagetes erecta]